MIMLIIKYKRHQGKQKSRLDALYILHPFAGCWLLVETRSDSISLKDKGLAVSYSKDPGYSKNMQELGDVANVNISDCSWPCLGILTPRGILSGRQMLTCSAT